MIDAHFHLWGEPFPHRPFPWTPDPFPLADMLATFDSFGVSTGFDVTPIMYQWDNSYSLLAAEQSEGRVRVFARFDPLAPEPERRLRQLVAHPSVAGIRLTFYGPATTAMEEPRLLDPLWRAAAELGVRVAVFAPDVLWTVVDIAERHPDLPLVIDHLGLGVYPGCEDPLRHQAALSRFAEHPLCLVKISGAVEVSREAFPFRDMQDIVHRAREDFGAERLLWGSNFPVAMSHCTYAEALAFVDECGFSDDERAEVLAGTALRILAAAEALRHDGEDLS